MHVQVGNDYSDFHDDPLAFGQRAGEGARKRSSLVPQGGSPPGDGDACRGCEVRDRTADLVLHRTSPDNKQRWHDGVSHRTEAMTNPTSARASADPQRSARRGSSPARDRRARSPRERSPETSRAISRDIGLNRTYFT